jgi:8-oxo-dGTP diphosphatase
VTPPRSGLLARGPWRPEEVDSHWREDAYEPPPELVRMADEAVDDLRERGSPAHDGLATRLVGWREDSLTALCVVRSADGRWLAGRRAGWVAVWANRWALGAGGSVDLGESPAETLSRELREEWQLSPERLTVEALVGLPNGLAMLVGLASVGEGAQPVPDAEHDDWAWWPADVGSWPAEADERLKMMAQMLAASG